MPKKKAPEPPGARLRRLRESAGLTQARVAEKAGLSQGWIGHLETGRKPAGLDMLYSLATAIGCDPHELDARLASVKPAP